MRRSVGNASRLELRTLDPDEESLLPAAGTVLISSGATSPQGPEIGDEGHPADDKNFLRIHKFDFQWDLSMHLSLCIVSLLPFIFSGNMILSIAPLCIWVFYNGE